MGDFKSFWDEKIFYFKQPEMRLFWIFLFLAFSISGIELFYLPGYLSLITSLIFVGIAGIVFFSSFKLAKNNFAVQFEKRQLEGMVTNLYDGVIAYDTNFRIMMFNKTAETIFLIKKEEVEGKEFTPQFAQNSRYTRLAQIMFPSLAPVVITRSEAGIFPQIVDLSFSNPVAEFRVTTVKMTDENKKLIGFMKIIRDRTREIEAGKSKSEFVTVAAHQLRTPLNAVSWTFETLSGENNLPDDLRELVKNGRLATAKVLKTVNDLLDVAKIEEGNFGYVMEEIEFTGFLENILAQKMVIAKQYGIRMYFDRPQNKNLKLKIDTKRMTMAIDNILDNAIKYNVKNGEITVKLEKLEEKPFIQVSITDTGIGIPPEEVKKLFTKFFRATNVLKFQTEGTGLGIYIAKNIIRQHGGEIYAESTLNRGTTIYFSLPIDPNLIPIKEVFVEE
ncbi:MAG: ATP-binding protein [Candidatus Pacebacteria bacterium]|nr:ATP-binding protein [Candidatus Paceibacterota bacterium]